MVFVIVTVAGIIFLVFYCYYCFSLTYIISLIINSLDCETWCGHVILFPLNNEKLMMMIILSLLLVISYFWLLFHIGVINAGCVWMGSTVWLSRHIVCQWTNNSSAIVWNWRHWTAGGSGELSPGSDKNFWKNVQNELLHWLPGEFTPRIDLRALYSYDAWLLSCIRFPLCLGWHYRSWLFTHLSL